MTPERPCPTFRAATRTLSAAAPATARAARRLGLGSRIASRAWSPSNARRWVSGSSRVAGPSSPGSGSASIGIGVVGLYVLLFVVLNTHRIKVSFVVGSTRVSLIWVILLSLAAGLFIGVLASQLHRHRSRH